MGNEEIKCLRCGTVHDLKMGLGPHLCVRCGSALIRVLDEHEVELVDDDEALVLEPISPLIVAPSVSDVESTAPRPNDVSTNANFLFGLLVAVCVLLMVASIAAVFGVMLTLNSGQMSQNAVVPAPPLPNAEVKKVEPSAPTSKEPRGLVDNVSTIPPKPVETPSPEASSQAKPSAVEPELKNTVVVDPNNAAEKKLQLKSNQDPLDRCKAATVFVKVKNKKSQGSGSGFLLRKEGNIGRVVTNAHVVAAKEGDTLESIQCVFYSGLPNEFTVSAEVIGLNPLDDLAVLKVDSSQLPEELHCKEDIELREAQSVFVVGFPFGEMFKTNERNPNLSMSRRIISSVRRDRTGDIVTLQIDGGINPGNSGGPVVTEDGLLAGIAVAKLKVADIGFAIPPHVLFEFLEGKLGKPVLRPHANLSGTSKFHVEIALIDPEQNISAVDVLTMRKSQVTQPVSKGGVFDESFIEWQPHPLDIAKSTASGFVEVPANAPNFQYQIRWQSKNGGLHFSGLADFRPPSKNGESDGSWEVLKMPGRFSEVAVAAGGKYLVFHLPTQKRLDVFETARRQFVKSLPVPGEGLCTAGMDRILFVQSATKKLFQWNLTSFDLMKTDTLDFPVKPTLFAMGSASQGPLFIGNNETLSSQYKFFELETLKPIEKSSDPRPHRIERDSIVRASNNGNLFTISSHGSSEALFLEDGSSFQDDESGGYLIPNHDGKLLYSRFRIRPNDIKKTVVDLSKPPAFCNIPNLEGNGYLRVTKPPEYFGEKLVPMNATICSASGKVLHSELSIPLYNKYGMIWDKRIYLYLKTKMLIVLPQLNNEIQIRRL